MTALFVLIILASGYLAVIKHPYVRYRLHRFEGQHLYLLTIYWGVKCLLISFVIYFSLICLSEHPYFTYLDLFSNFEDVIVSKLASKGFFIGTEDKADECILMVIIALLSCLSAYLLKMLGHASLKRKYGRWTADSFVIASILADSPLDQLVIRSFFCTDRGHKDFLLMLTMDDHKVYVGKVVDCGEPSETDGIDQEILIIPVLSGYRDEEHKVSFTTSYGILDQVITLVLPQDRIRAATSFSMKAYLDFHAQENNGCDQKIAPSPGEAAQVSTSTCL